MIVVFTDSTMSQHREEGTSILDYITDAIPCAQEDPKYQLCDEVELFESSQATEIVSDQQAQEEQDAYEFPEADAIPEPPAADTINAIATRPEDPVVSKKRKRQMSVEIAERDVRRRLTQEETVLRVAIRRQIRDDREMAQLLTRQRLRRERESVNRKTIYNV